MDVFETDPLEYDEFFELGRADVYRAVEARIPNATPEFQTFAKQYIWRECAGLFMSEYQERDYLIRDALRVFRNFQDIT